MRVIWENVYYDSIENSQSRCAVSLCVQDGGGSQPAIGVTHAGGRRSGCDFNGGWSEALYRGREQITCGPYRLD